MYKNDVDAALLQLSEKELLIAILKSQAEVYRRLDYIEKLCSALQKEQIRDDEKQAKWGSQGRPGDAFADVLRYIEGASQPGNSAQYDQTTLTETLLSGINDLNISRHYTEEEEQ